VIPEAPNISKNYIHFIIKKMSVDYVDFGYKFAVTFILACSIGPIAEIPRIVINQPVAYDSFDFKHFECFQATHVWL
jgi:hypothetical protein